MYLEFALSVHKMSRMLCQLLSSNLSSVSNYDLSLFQVYMVLFHFPLMCMRESLIFKSCSKKVVGVDVVIVKSFSTGKENL